MTEVLTDKVPFLEGKYMGEVFWAKSTGNAEGGRYLVCLSIGQEPEWLS